MTSLLSRSRDERGAVLLLVASLLLVLMVVGAIAVDLSALDRRGQTLQNTADAAVLAGVDVWFDTGDAAQATATITSIIEQNGVDLADDVNLDIAFPAPNTVTVELIDNKPDTYLSGVVGLQGQLERESTAEISGCNIACNLTVRLPEPIGDSLEANGFGDGYIPAKIGARLYGVNHHGGYIDCIDRLTSQACWPGRLLFPNGGVTANVLHTPVFGDRVFYSGLNGWFRQTMVTCWDDSLDSRCPIQTTLGNHGHSTLVDADGRLFVFTSTRKVFCLIPDTLQSCAGYSGGKDTALASLWPWDTTLDGAGMAEGIVHNGKIYHTVFTNDYKVYLHCWDTATDAACASFGTHLVNTTGSNTWDQWNNGRLFLARTPARTPTSICSLGELNLECYDFDSGARLPAEESQFAGLHSAMLTRPWNSWTGSNSYHEYSNRLFTVNAHSSVTYCHDFNTQSYCGEEINVTSLGPARTYGYISDGACVIGLGDAAIFFSVKSDLATTCNGSSRDVELSPCSCSGQLLWPPIEIVESDLVEVFEARVLASDGTVLLPASGNGWIDLTSEALDLSSIALSQAPITIELYAESLPGEDAWLGEDDPGIIVGAGVSPRLID